MSVILQSHKSNTFSNTQPRQDILLINSKWNFVACVEKMVNLYNERLYKVFKSTSYQKKQRPPLLRPQANFQEQKNK